MRRCWVKVVLPGAVLACAVSAVVAGGAGAGVAAVVSVTHVGARPKAIEVPGLGALNRGGYAVVTSVSCGSAGNCAAGGSYLARSGRLQAFVVSRT